ncbi:MAG: DUF374 domain-containing protein [Pirellulaceae bacterium]|nr:DUF374 domain-containing protein [Pirellulaceae bacterium]
MAIRYWMRTLDYRGYYYDSSVDVAHESFRGPVIYLLWHEYVPIFFYLRSQTNLGILASRHRDAEWLSQMAILEGLQVFRGSSGRGGVGALKAIVGQQDLPGFAITPDGPRGPRREMAAGAIFLASKIQAPLVLVGLGYENPWRNYRAWDKFAIPKLGSRARAIFSPRICVPEKLTRDELEQHRFYAERTLNILTATAELWAATNRPFPGSIPMFRSSNTFQEND